MARNIQFYSQGKNTVVISSSNGGSRTIKDFHQGESIRWEPTQARINVTEGLDGSAISISSAKSGKITITLKPTSPDCDYLNSVANNNDTNPQFFTVTIVSGVEEKVVLQNAGLHADAAGSGDTTMTPRTFIFTGTILTHSQS